MTLDSGQASSTNCMGFCPSYTSSEQEKWRFSFPIKIFVEQHEMKFNRKNFFILFKKIFFFDISTVKTRDDSRLFDSKTESLVMAKVGESEQGAKASFKRKTNELMNHRTDPLSRLIELINRPGEREQIASNKCAN